MAYLQHTSWKDRPGAVIGVVAFHAIVGYGLVTGLSFSGIIEKIESTEGYFVPDVPLPPPPPPPEPTPQQESMDQPLVAPKPKLDVSPMRPEIDTTPIIVPVPQPLPYVVPKPSPLPPAPVPKPAFDAVAAKPRGNPGTWVTVNDYRSNWINREWTGVARFKLDIGANGRVENCTITVSSGHAELDKATCQLVTSRARFDPATDTTGAKTTGTYSNSVRWELPE